MATTKPKAEGGTPEPEATKPDQVITQADVANANTALNGDAKRDGLSPWRPDFDVALPAEIEEFLANTRPESQDRDPEAVSMEIMLRILQAKSLDDVFAGSQLVHAGEILNTPITVHSVKWNKSDIGGGPGIYAVITAWDHVMSREVTISVGGLNVIAQLYMLNKFEAFPMVVQFEQSPKPTASGYYPLWLKPRPDVPMMEGTGAVD